ncbi:MAG TPA: UDP-N-acetylmuramoyl-L-alanyl-D-glutamate--2,6-diaminopimelate ligase [Bauldia sp.]|nr:UDP-N-acetylmuramoyl-L-alanyl-D-glutamate--2,6-diaminopimelate ligase [Bauldia sp.]
MLLEDLVPPDVTVPEGAGSIDVKGVSADSRTVQAQSLFVALAGTHTDGAKFVADAVTKGAVAILAQTDAAIVATVPILRSADPRRALALIAARFRPFQPTHLVAVTGTSGKTSVADFTRQIFAATGNQAASIGTLGVVTASGADYGTMTTPDPVALHTVLDELAERGITHAAIEASSQGLDQRRVDGLKLEAAAFTNLGRDHMDYHPTVEAYLAAKLRLFNVVLPPSGVAVIDMDGAYAAEVEKAASERGQILIRTGKAGEELKLVERTPKGFRQQLIVSAFGKEYEVSLPLAGAFQASNALVAAGLAIGAGIETQDALNALSNLKGAPGRLELVGSKQNGAMVFLDYAHKPDALVSVLRALRPMTEGVLYVVFGAGGDRDPGKRSLMGAAAHANADVVIVTDDNPRSENPAAIRKAIMDAAPDAIEIADRGDAIRRAVKMLGNGDVLVVAGKGHETGQIIGSRTIPFSDRDAVTAALAAEEAA